uniref:SJCHGC06960 protein n=1 Tax=Schistosoma japonicum TaxID=6182 RepID=Q3KTI3_SCHJA|nr:SJCHGC06960 protein [Schistosoma japonicum]
MDGSFKVGFRCRVIIIGWTRQVIRFFFQTRCCIFHMLCLFQNSMIINTFRRQFHCFMNR